MRIARYLFVFAVLFPLGAGAALTQGSAADSSATARPKCFMTSSANPSSAKSFTLMSAASEVRDFLQQAVVCPTACYNEQVTLNVGMSGIDVKISAQSQCGKDRPTVDAAQKYNLGCTQGKDTSPIVTVYITGVTEKKIGPKSRCDTTTLTQAVSALSQKDFTGALTQLQNVLEPSFAAPAISNPQDPAQYSSMLKAFDGTLTDQQIADAIKNNPDDVKTIAACAANSSTCTPDTLKQAAGNIGIKLNSDVTGQIAQMKANWEAQQNADGGQSVDQGPQNLNTGFNRQNVEPGEVAQPRTQCGIQGMAGLFAAIESACGRNVTSATTNVQGVYQFMCGTWASYTARTGNSQYSNCGYANDPVVATQVMNDTIDKIYRPEFGNTINQLGIKENSGLYMPHLLGENGANKFFALYAQNPNMSADALRATLGNAAVDNNRSLFYAGNVPRTLSGVLAEVDRRMTGTQYTGGLATGGSPFAGSGAYYGGSPVGYGYTSPFALGYGTSYPGPVSTGYPVSTGAPVSTGGPVSTQSGNSVTQQISQIAGGTNGAPAGTAATAPLPPVATLIVQPKTVPAGNPVTVSWSSVGMRPDPSCQVLIQSASGTPAALALGNEGSKTIQADPPGVLTFTLNCSALNGSQIQKTASVSVQ